MGGSVEPGAHGVAAAVKAGDALEQRGLVRRLGRWGIDWFRYARSLWRFLRRAIAVMLSSGTRSGGVVARSTLQQIRFTGVDAVPVVVLVASLLGAAIVIQALSYLSSGGAAVVGSLMDVLVIREVAPLMTAVIITGRSGSAITVDLANRKVNGEVELLELMGIDPMHYLVVPRVVAVTYASLCLCVLFDIVAIVGGYNLAALAVDTPGAVFLREVGSAISPTGVVVGLSKSAGFGLIIATVSTWHGLAAEGSPTVVPIHTQRSVVHSLVACLGLGFLITLLSSWQQLF